MAIGITGKVEWIDPVQYPGDAAQIAPAGPPSDDLVR
jgi:hypothetical protein